MTLSELWILGFILHLLGDYIIQNDWMAINKKIPNTKGLLACFIHCFTYAVPFLFILGWTAVFWIFFTHFLIDRWKLVDWFIALKNGNKQINNFGFSEDRPIIVTLWLYIITDNIFHIFCNTFIIWYYAQV
jgi:hypothetical protein